MNNRARIFLPMDALRGFKEALQEKETLKEERKILLEDEQILLSNQLLNLKENLSVLIKYYDICNYQVILMILLILFFVKSILKNSSLI